MKYYHQDHQLALALENSIKDEVKKKQRELRAKAAEERAKRFKQGGRNNKKKKKN
jgi:hypothetical protein